MQMRIQSDGVFHHKSVGPSGFSSRITQSTGIVELSGRHEGGIVKLMSTRRDPGLSQYARPGEFTVRYPNVNRACCMTRFSPKQSDHLVYARR